MTSNQKALCSPSVNFRTAVNSMISSFPSIDVINLNANYYQTHSTTNNHSVCSNYSYSVDMMVKAMLTSIVLLRAILGSLSQVETIDWNDVSVNILR